jgi:hypothetical protein
MKMPKGHYLGGSTIIRSGSDWFGKGTHKSDEARVSAPKPRNIFKQTAEGRKAEKEFLETLAEERRKLGIKPKRTKKVTTGLAKQRNKKRKKQKIR